MIQVQMKEHTRPRVKATIPTVEPVRQVTRQVEEDQDAHEAAALYEWQAAEHTHRPKSAGWYIALAASITTLVTIFLFMANFMAAVTVSLAGGLIYYLAQRHPATVRYRLLADGVAVNNTMYQYRNLKSFHVIYQPDEVKTVIIHGQQRFAPLLHLEIGDANPRTIHNILIQHVPENIELEEPLVDIWARRLGF